MTKHTPLTESDLTEAIDDAAGICDPVALYECLMMISDRLDLDLARVCAKIKYERPIDEDENLILDIIYASQSNPSRSLNLLIRCAIAERMIPDAPSA
jgi:hypothetical protein